MTGATMATHLTLVKPGDVVIGVSASHSHPSVVRAAQHVGARFIDSAGLGAFRDAIQNEPTVALVVLARLAVTYDLLPLDVINTAVRLAHDKGALVYVDDAGGARVQPLSVSRGCWISALTSVRLGSINTALRAHVSGGRRQERSGQPDPGERLRVRHGGPADALSGGSTNS